MNSPNLKSVLSTLISLTNERDITALEISLAQALFNLIAPLNVDTAKSITIYHVKDIEKQLFAEIVIGKEPDGYSPSPDMKQMLTNCYEVLLMLSQLMTQTFRDTDLIFRFGGEEFLGVFECSSPADIGQILERFRKKVSRFEFPQVGKVTISSGYTMISADDGSSQMIDRADLALYYAKNNGRNHICQYEQLVADGSLQGNKKEGVIELF